MYGKLYHPFEIKHRLHQYHEVSILSVMVAPSSFSNKSICSNDASTPQSTPNSTRNGFCTSTVGFSDPQIREFCLLKYPPRWKWTSSEKMIFFGNILFLVATFSETKTKRKLIHYVQGDNILNFVAE